MLTTAQLAVFINYQWDLRFFESQASTAEKELMSNVDWDEVNELLQDLRLYHQHLVSKEYARKILANLRQVCADEETAQILLGYASTL